MHSTIGVVIALYAEAACLAGRRGWRRAGNHLMKRIVLTDRSRLVAACSGMGVENARSAARMLVADGAGALVGIGVSAGVSPELNAGDLVIADRLVAVVNGAASEVWKADDAIIGKAGRKLVAAGLDFRCGTLATTAGPVFTSEVKNEVFGRSGALALDMESAAVTEVAAEAGVSCFILRAVSDPVMQSVPPRLFACLDGYGGLQYPVFFREIFSDPLLVFKLIPLALQFRAACRSLAAGWAVLNSSGIMAGLLAHSDT